MLSNTAEYALRALIHLAEHQEEGPLRVDDVATALGVPRNYLSKVLHVLAKRGLLTSSRGPKGGFELGVPAEALSLYAAVEPFDDIEARRSCLLGQQACSDEHPCEVHGLWKDVAGRVATFFRETTLADVVDDRERGAAERVTAILER
jgi:Rrf2 family protein